MANGELLLIEPIAIMDIFAMGLAMIEDLGDGMRRLVFFAPHQLPDGKIERHIVAKLVLPEACILQISRQLMAGADEVLQGILTLVPRNHTAGG